MKKRQTWFVVLLAVIMMFDSPQIARAEALGHSISSSNYRLFYDYGIQLKDEDKDEYNIKYYFNGGEAGRDTFYTYREEELPVKLPVPERAGYNFAGWYLDTNYKHKISAIWDSQYGDMMLYAKWTRSIDSAYNVQMYQYKSGDIIGDSNKKLKDCDYGFVNSITIPGMPATREKDYIDNMISTDGQCPQGICLTDDYYLVTAYATDDKESLGSMYVFDRETGEYLVTLGMKKRSHLGGLTYDGTNVWICHSDSRALERISYEYIRNVAESKPKSFIDSTGLFEEYKVWNMPSCVASYDGKLWVATHNSYTNSIMVAYEYRDDELQAVNCYKIPEKVQGITFDVDGNVYLSTSYGRGKSSYLRVYDNVKKLNNTPDHPVMEVEMPPCSEEICMSDGRIYILFESASRKYFEGTDGRGRSIAPIDKILTVEISSLVTP